MSNTPAKTKATSTTVDAQGRAPMLANIVKFVRCNTFQKDQDSIVKFIGANTEDWFYFIVTRPGLTRESPPKKRLMASKSVSAATWKAYTCLLRDDRKPGTTLTPVDHSIVFAPSNPSLFPLQMLTSQSSPFQHYAWKSYTILVRTL
jgi:hypothetical protein